MTISYERGARGGRRDTTVAKAKARGQGDLNIGDQGMRGGGTTRGSSAQVQELVAINNQQPTRGWCNMRQRHQRQRTCGGGACGREAAA